MTPTPSAARKPTRRRQWAALRAQERLLRYILDHSDATCRAASEALGMSFPNVCRLVSSFKRSGTVLVRENRPTGKRGPWSQIVSLAPRLGSTVGVDLEATQVRAVLMDFGNDIVKVMRRPLPASADGGAVRDAVAEVAGALVDLARRQRRNPCVVGLGLPGPVRDVARGRIQTELQGGEVTIEFADAVKSRCKTPVFSVANTRCFAAAHHRLRGWPKDSADLLVLNRFGVGVALVWKSELYTGASGLAGELGLIRYSLDGLSRYQDVCSGASLLRMDRRRGGDRAITAVLENPDDPVLRQWLLSAIPAFADALCLAVHLYDPTRIVVEGVLNGLPGAVHQQVRALFDESVAASGFSPPPLEFFQEDDLMGARGAALLARDDIVSDVLQTALGAA